jgi:hypothetical protein
MKVKNWNHFTGVFPTKEIHIPQHGLGMAVLRFGQSLQKKRGSVLTTTSRLLRYIDISIIIGFL